MAERESTAGGFEFFFWSASYNLKPKEWDSINYLTILTKKWMREKDQSDMVLFFLTFSADTKITDMHRNHYATCHSLKCRWACLLIFVFQHLHCCGDKVGLKAAWLEWLLDWSHPEVATSEWWNVASVNVGVSQS